MRGGAVLIRNLVAMVLLVVVMGAGARPVVFDNDMAIDDWATLLYLAHYSEADLRAITIAASGESHCEPGLENALSLLELPGDSPGVPVACGDDYPLDGYAVFPEAWREDSDTLSGVPVPASDREPSERHAADVIHSVLQDAGEPVTLVATGPLTNIAQWLERYPGDREAVGRLVIMGGNVDVPGNIIVPGFTDGHPNTTAEWNFFIDPVAADRVLAAGLPTVLVGLDVTNEVPVTPAFAQRFKESVSTRSARFWDSVLDANDWFIDSGEYYFWDVLAGVTAMDASLCVGEQRRLRVVHETTEDPRGQTTDDTMPERRWDGRRRSHLDAASAGTLVRDSDRPPVKVCFETEPERVYRHFRRTLNQAVTGE